MQKLGKRMQLRQQVLATASVYFKRFYTRNTIRNSSPILVAATCVYMACKVEETPMHIKNIVAEMRHVMNGDTTITLPDVAAIAECEFYILEDMEFYTIVFHPYRPLVNYVQDLKLDKSFLQTAWYIVNDCYKCDLPLLYPPHMIALAAIYLASALNAEAAKGADFTSWFASLNVEMEDLIVITQDIFDLYQVMGEYSDDEIPQILERLNTSLGTLPTTPIVSTPPGSTPQPQPLNTTTFSSMTTSNNMLWPPAPAGSSTASGTPMSVPPLRPFPPTEPASVASFSNPPTANIPNTANANVLMTQGSGAGGRPGNSDQNNRLLDLGLEEFEDGMLLDG
ncbi:hypothetical protein HDU76_010519 [Blyttiomyces sp. JEL0837]|nr:hypothetical protein HDU76_010519 [Blyttiomyces sp. JEL0837]